jgi:CHAT domain-containing protein
MAVLHLAFHSRANESDPLQRSLQLEDGPLTLHDIYGLHLELGPLVVLSSCSSGLGQSSPGAEPISLATAFASAGAQSVLSALWTVDDEQTRQLFTRFYTELARGATPLDALRAGQAECHKAHPESHDWAAFVLSGNPD